MSNSWLENSQIQPPSAAELTAWESHVHQMVSAFNRNAHTMVEQELLWDGDNWIISARHRVWLEDDDCVGTAVEEHGIESMRQIKVPHGTPISEMIATGNRMWADCRNEARSIRTAIRQREAI